MRTGSAVPTSSQSASREGFLSGLYGSLALRPDRLLASPRRIRPGMRPASAGFYFQAFSRLVGLPAAGYYYGSNWNLLPVESRDGAVVKAKVCVLCLPSGFPTVPHYFGHAPFPSPAHRTGRAELPHPALGPDSPQAFERLAARSVDRQTSP